MAFQALVRQERRAATAVLTLDQPDRLNVLSEALIGELVAAFDAIEAEPDMRCVILTGAGRGFSAGGDLADAAGQMADGEAWPRLRYMRAMQAAIRRIRESRLPVVASVDGPVYGAAWSLVLACDLVVATEGARFCQAFIKRDLVPDLGSAWLLPRTVGALVARELMLLGDEIPAQRARELGLVNRTVATREEAEREAHRLAERLASIAPATMAMTKRLIDSSATGSLEASMRLEEHAQSVALGTPETAAAMRAFLERRTDRPSGPERGESA
jgi:2-(1,2-epoxy-1,2-dihydrophenyl)acetyl-CoA isomerase